MQAEGEATFGVSLPKRISSEEKNGERTCIVCTNARPSETLKSTAKEPHSEPEDRGDENQLTITAVIKQWGLMDVVQEQSQYQLEVKRESETNTDLGQVFAYNRVPRAWSPVDTENSNDRPLNVNSEKLRKQDVGWNSIANVDQNQCSYPITGDLQVGGVCTRVPGDKAYMCYSKPKDNMSANEGENKLLYSTTEGSGDLNVPQLPSMNNSIRASASVDKNKNNLLITNVRGSSGHEHTGSVCTYLPNGQQSINVHISEVRSLANTDEYYEDCSTHQQEMGELQTTGHFPNSEVDRVTTVQSIYPFSNVPFSVSNTESHGTSLSTWKESVSAAPQHMSPQTTDWTTNCDVSSKAMRDKECTKKSSKWTEFYRGIQYDNTYICLADGAVTSSVGNFHGTQTALNCSQFAATTNKCTSGVAQFPVQHTYDGTNTTSTENKPSTSQQFTRLSNSSTQGHKGSATFKVSKEKTKRKPRRRRTSGIQNFVIQNVKNGKVVVKEKIPVSLTSSFVMQTPPACSYSMPPVYQLTSGNDCQGYRTTFKYQNSNANLMAMKTPQATLKTSVHEVNAPLHVPVLPVSDRNAKSSGSNFLSQSTRSNLHLPVMVPITQPSNSSQREIPVVATSCNTSGHITTGDLATQVLRTCTKCTTWNKVSDNSSESTLFEIRGGSVVVNIPSKHGTAFEHNGENLNMVASNLNVHVPVSSMNNNMLWEECNSCSGYANDSMQSKGSAEVKEQGVANDYPLGSTHDDSNKISEDDGIHNQNSTHSLSEQGNTDYVYMCDSNANVISSNKDAADSANSAIEPLYTGNTCDNEETDTASESEDGEYVDYQFYDPSEIIITASTCTCTDNSLLEGGKGPGTFLSSVPSLVDKGDGENVVENLYQGTSVACFAQESVTNGADNQVLGIASLQSHTSVCIPEEQNLPDQQVLFHQKGIQRPTGTPDGECEVLKASNDQENQQHFTAKCTCNLEVINPQRQENPSKESDNEREKGNKGFLEASPKAMGKAFTSQESQWFGNESCVPNKTLIPGEQPFKTIACDAFECFPALNMATGESSTTIHKSQPNCLYKCLYPNCNRGYDTLIGISHHLGMMPNHKICNITLKYGHLSVHNEVNFFLPKELDEKNRKVRLEMLFKEISDEELIDLALPRLSKCVSSLGFIEQKVKKPCQRIVKAARVFKEFQYLQGELETKLKAMKNDNMLAYTCSFNPRCQPNKTKRRRKSLKQLNTEKDKNSGWHEEQVKDSVPISGNAPVAGTCIVHCDAKETCCSSLIPTLKNLCIKMLQTSGFEVNEGISAGTQTSQCTCGRYAPSGTPSLSLCTKLNTDTCHESSADLYPMRGDAGVLDDFEVPIMLASSTVAECGNSFKVSSMETLMDACCLQPDKIASLQSEGSSSDDDPLSLPYEIVKGMVVPRCSKSNPKTKPSFLVRDFKEFAASYPSCASEVFLDVKDYSMSSKNVFRQYLMPQLLKRNYQKFVNLTCRLAIALDITGWRIDSIFNGRLGKDIKEVLGINIFPRYAKVAVTLNQMLDEVKKRDNEKAAKRTERKDSMCPKEKGIVKNRRRKLLIVQRCKKRKCAPSNVDGMEKGCRSVSKKVKQRIAEESGKEGIVNMETQGKSQTPSCDPSACVKSSTFTMPPGGLKQAGKTRMKNPERLGRQPRSGSSVKMRALSSPAGIKVTPRERASSSHKCRAKRKKEIAKGYQEVLPKKKKKTPGTATSRGRNEQDVIPDIDVAL